MPDVFVAIPHVFVATLRRGSPSPEKGGNPLRRDKGRVGMMWMSPRNIRRMARVQRTSVDSCLGGLDDVKHGRGKGLRGVALRCGLRFVLDVGARKRDVLNVRGAHGARRSDETCVREEAFLVEENRDTDISQPGSLRTGSLCVKSIWKSAYHVTLPACTVHAQSLPYVSSGPTFHLHSCFVRAAVNPHVSAHVHRGGLWFRCVRSVSYFVITTLHVWQSRNNSVTRVPSPLF
jgi:hypothetical protein